jgi:quinol monooxygenase YgiN
MPTDLDQGEFITEPIDVPEDEFVVFGTVHAKPEHADALEAVYAETTRLAEFESGTIYYCLARDSEDPSIFHFFERYAGKKAFDAHNAQPIIQKLMEDEWFIGVKAKFMKAIGPASV